MQWAPWWAYRKAPFRRRAQMLSLAPGAISMWWMRQTLPAGRRWRSAIAASRSEEHTSELQSQSNLACRLLLEKKTRERALLPRYIVTAHDLSPVTVYTRK